MTKYTEVELPYGDSFLKARVPTKNLSYILNSKYIKGLEDEQGAVTSSLRDPIGRPPLYDCIDKNDKVVVLVTDNTRPCPDDRLLPPILAELERKIPRENITIIVAVGLHPPLTEPQLVKKLGKDIVDNYNVVNHDVNQCVYIGTTSRGTPVDINTRVVEADFRFSTGFIEPHWFAGFSGGRKSIAPGVFSVRSAYKNHSYSMLDHPRSISGIIKGNIVHTHIVAGDPVKAHEKGCEIEADISQAKAPHKVDITITTNSGAPLDLDLYQACKGMNTASRITRDGGIVIIASACGDGKGPEEFVELHASVSSPKEVLRKIRREEPIGVQWQNQILARDQLRNDFYLVSCIDDKTVRDMMITPIRTIEEGLEKALKIIGDDAEIAVIPEGPLVVPVLED